MSKLSKGKRTNIFSAIVIAVTILAVLIIIIAGGDFSKTIEVIGKADLRWLLGAFGVWCGFVFFDALFMQVYLTQQGERVNFLHSISNALIGMFYSNITPASTGGQPMQVLSYRKRGVHSGVASSCMAVKFFCWQTALLVCCTVMWIVNPGAIDPVPDTKYPFIVLGYILNGAAVAVVVLLAISPRIVRALVNAVIRVGKFLHIVKDVEESKKKLEGAINDFNESVNTVRRHPLRLLVLLAIAVAQVFTLLSIIYFIYRAVVPAEAAVLPYKDILTLQLLLYVVASFCPLPGAAGAQEVGFALFFGHVFTGVGEQPAAMILWRFFTYYIMIILGLGGVIEDRVYSIRKAKRENGQTETDGTVEDSKTEQDGSR